MGYLDVCEFIRWRLNYSHLYKAEIELDDYMWECINPNMGG
ncbi:hypothetical protein [Bacillus cereus]|nr:hypothetical protein [Bacillus cereus]MDR4985869.1 hypothetical protein [Bacillus cereus]